MLYRLNDGKDFRPQEHNLYFLFGLKSSAGKDEVKAAYRRLTRKYHPDFHGGDKRFEEAFRIINSIYGILSDYFRRQDYNQTYRRRIQEMLEWSYDASDYSEDGYALIPAGKHRVRIENAEEQIARTSGKDMIKLTLAVSGYNMKLWKYIVLDNSDSEKVKRTNQWLGSVFSSFSITPGNLDLATWIGRSGGAMVKHTKDISGTERAEVHYFLKRSDVDELPSWQEGARSQSGGRIDPDMQDFGDTGAEGIPF